MSSRPRDMHLPPGAGPRLSPEAAALIPREPEAKVHNNAMLSVGSYLESKTHFLASGFCRDRALKTIKMN